MKKIIVTIIFLVLSSVVYGKSMKFTCELQKLKGQGEIIFKVKDMDASFLELENIATNYEGEEVPVTFSGSSSRIESYAFTLNVDGPEVYRDKKNIYLIGDKESCNTVKIYLYENSNYRHGFLKATYLCGGDSGFYSKISCKIE